MNEAKETKYDVAKEFSAGFVASLKPSARLLSESDHWLAGWDAGYAFRDSKNSLMDEYLVSIGLGRMGVVRAALAAADGK
jgi:hypothetical protein